MFVLAVLPALILVTVAQTPPDDDFSQLPKAFYVVREGDSVTIECVTARPTALCVWKTDLPGLPALRGFLTDGSTIEGLPEINAVDPNNPTNCSINITAVSSKYNGKYTCSPFIYDKGHVDSTTELFVVQAVAQPPPDDDFSQLPKAFYAVLEGDSVTIECVTARPTELCAWKTDLPGLAVSGFLADGSTIEELPEIKAVDPKSQTDCSINITAVSSKYNGNYTCSPFMDHGRVNSTTTELIVFRTVAQPPPDDDFSPMPQAIHVVPDGISVTMKCGRPTAICGLNAYLPGLPVRGFLSHGRMIEELPEINAADPNNPRNCSINITPVSSKYNGKYTCRILDHNLEFYSATTSELIVAQKPVAVEFTDDLAGQREMTVIANKLQIIACEARDARPKADLVWYLGDRQLFDGLINSDVVDEVSQLVTSRSVLVHWFAKEDDGATLRCEARHPVYGSQETDAALIMVMVQFAPYRAEGSSLGTIDGFIPGHEGHVTVNFTANPPPYDMFWTVGEGEYVYAGYTSKDGRFSAGPLEEVAGAQHQYSLQLHIQPVKMEDQDVTFDLRMINGAGHAIFDFRLDTGAAPPPPSLKAAAGISG